MVLYVMLAASAVVAFWARGGTAPPVVGQFAPWLFLAFALGFAAYRVALVAARRYSPFKAFMQIAIAALFFMLLLNRGALPVRQGSDLSALLEDRDPRVRSLAAEVVGRRKEIHLAKVLVGRLTDPDVEVRNAAHEALVRLNDGADLGAPEDIAAVILWRERFQ